MAKTKRRVTNSEPRDAQAYRHPTAESPLRPDVGTQPQFKKIKPPAKYQYDSSLSPSLQWTGKAERVSFEVPTLPLFVHERLSTKAIIETLKGHRKDEGAEQLDLFGDPQLPIVDQPKAYEHMGKWVNRIILGDSLVVMNSLQHYENLAGQVQMIYMDPPYGVNFGSNFQPFVRKRDVKHNEDTDLTREPEMVKAYRDTWELGLHSYLTYLRDRLFLGRELLSPSGSIFLQISDKNLHHVRELMDEVFGHENFVVTILIKKKGGQKGELIDPVNDYLLWYAKDIEKARKKFHSLFQKGEVDADLVETFRNVELPNGKEMTLAELTKQNDNGTNYSEQPEKLFKDYPGARLFTSENITSGGYRRTQSVIFEFKGKSFDPGIAKGNCWKHSAITDDGAPSGMEKLAKANRLYVGEDQLRFKRYFDDFGYKEISNWWDSLGGASKPIYVVQTNPEIVKRCILMTTDPGDLVLDPTCGSGTTAYVAEQWGRRWITIDASRVPLALAKQRILTSTFPYYKLLNEANGPVSGFEFQRKQNSRGEEIGGIVPHITSSSIANNEQPTQEVIVDRPEIATGITRVAGPFCVEATIPTPMNVDEVSSSHKTDSISEDYGSYISRMMEVLRRSPVLQVSGGKKVTLKNVRPPAKTLSLSAEAVVPNGTEKAVAIVFGPENAHVSERMVYEAAKEAHAKNYTHLYVIGFGIQPNARMLVEKSDETMGIPATFVAATPDLMMGDLLKNMRSSQIFSVCGQPEIEIKKVKPEKKGDPEKYQVELLGLDVFDPITMELQKMKGGNVPAWFLDTNYNGLCFHVTQAFFPRTSAWEDLKKALKTDYEETVWDHLAGAISAPFETGNHRQVAVKVIDDRGNELIVVKNLKEV